MPTRKKTASQKKPIRRVLRRTLHPRQGKGTDVMEWSAPRRSPKKSARAVKRPKKATRKKSSRR